MIAVRLNKWVDLVDRTAWAFILTMFSAFCVFGFDSWRPVLATAALAAFAAGGKATAAQNIGSSPIGDAVPGASVLEPERPTR